MLQGRKGLGMPGLCSEGLGVWVPVYKTGRGTPEPKWGLCACTLDLDLV